jgi:hypothetical protein
VRLFGDLAGYGELAFSFRPPMSCCRDETGMSLH